MGEGGRLCRSCYPLTARGGGRTKAKNFLALDHSRGPSCRCPPTVRGKDRSRKKGECRREAGSEKPSKKNINIGGMSGSGGEF